jgi:hypothetical protein
MKTVQALHYAATVIGIFKYITLKNVSLLMLSIFLHSAHRASQKTLTKGTETQIHRSCRWNINLKYRFSGIAKSFERFQRKFKILPGLAMCKHLLDLLIKRQRAMIVIFIDISRRVHWIWGMLVTVQCITSSCLPSVNTEARPQETTSITTFVMLKGGNLVVSHCGKISIQNVW